MKILLLNDNPVVTKLVTLSAKKTNDDVVSVHKLDEVGEGSYDLLVIDDALYDAESFSLLKEKIAFKKSLFVCSKENKDKGDFSITIKKPFLPTDMVEILTNIKGTLDDVEVEEESIADMPEEELLDDLELEGLEGLDNDIDDDIGDDLTFDDEDVLDTEDDIDNIEDISLDDFSEHEEHEEELGESILDDEEAEKVKELLDDTQEEEYDMALDLEDEADVDISDLLESDGMEADSLEENDNDEEGTTLGLDEEVDFDLDTLALDEELGLQEVPEEELSEEEESHEEEEISEENLFDEEAVPEEDFQEEEESHDEEEISEENLFDEEVAPEEDFHEEDISTEALVPISEIEDVPEDIETQIQDAVGELSDEDLQSEVDEETLLDIANNEIDSFANLSSKDLKVALGEEVDDEKLDENREVEESTVAPETEEEHVEDVIDSPDDNLQDESQSNSNSGIDALKTLLETLNDANVAASLKGAKITINISFEA